MYIAMNRFRVKPELANGFEQVWLNRDVHLTSVPGFISFYLLKGSQKEDHILYASHTLWETEGDFKAWLNSEQFKKSHPSSGEGGKWITESPVSEEFNIIQTVIG